MRFTAWEALYTTTHSHLCSSTLPSLDIPVARGEADVTAESCATAALAFDGTGDAGKMAVVIFSDGECDDGDDAFKCCQFVNQVPAAGDE